MNLELHITMWNTLKEHIIGSDLTEAAEDFVKVLIEHGADADKMTEYALDEEVTMALREYIELEDDEENIEFEYDDEYDD